jgi:hypothetical protein
MLVSGNSFKLKKVFMQDMCVRCLSVHLLYQNYLSHQNILQTMGGLLIPNRHLESIDQPVIFLAGPIFDAPLWQDKAVQYILSHDRNLYVASPRRGLRDSIEPYFLEADNTKFSRQRAWERHYMDLASRKGAIMFWLPERAEHTIDCVYGATTRFELGEWMTRYGVDPSVRLCIGSDGKFPTLSVITFDYSNHAPDKKILPSLEATCDQAMKLARSQFSKNEVSQSNSQIPAYFIYCSHVGWSCGDIDDVDKYVGPFVSKEVAEKNIVQLQNYIPPKPPPGRDIGISFPNPYGDNFKYSVKEAKAELLSDGRLIIEDHVFPKLYGEENDSPYVCTGFIL